MESDWTRVCVSALYLDRAARVKPLERRGGLACSCSRLRRYKKFGSRRGPSGSAGAHRTESAVSPLSSSVFADAPEEADEFVLCKLVLVIDFYGPRRPITGAE